MYHTCNQYDGYTRAEGDTTQQSNIMIWYDCYWGDVIGIGDTMFGREVALRKKEFEAAANHFSREERDAMRQRFLVMDAEEDSAAITEGLEPI